MVKLGGTREKLDRFIINDNWVQQYLYKMNESRIHNHNAKLLSDALSFPTTEPSMHVPISWSQLETKKNNSHTDAKLTII
jgi:hypothetical protein